MDQRYLVRPCLFATASAIDIALSVNKSASTTDGFVVATMHSSSLQTRIHDCGSFCFDVFGPQCPTFDWPYALTSPTIPLPVLHRRLAHRTALR
jgi:hypothetical protein